MKPIFVLVALVSCLIGCDMKNEKQELLLVGSYAEASESGIGIFNFDTETGKFIKLNEVKGVSNPSFLAINTTEDRIYAVNEESGKDAAVESFAFDRKTAKLTPLNLQSTKGDHPCHIVLDPSGERILASNYSGGSLTVFPIDELGQLLPDSELYEFDGSGVDSLRQAQSHIHSATFTPDGKYLLVCDLGTDRIYLYEVSKVVNHGDILLSVPMQVFIPLAPGSGPRHLTFNNKGDIAYVINELSGTIDVITYAEDSFRVVQTVLADSLHAGGSADIHLSPDGNYLYASHRLKGDGISIFKVDAISGMIEKIGYQSTGKHPRNFTITLNGMFLLVACRDDNAIEVYKRNKQTGLLTVIPEKIFFKQPVFLKLLQ